MQFVEANKETQRQQLGEAKKLLEEARAGMSPDVKKFKFVSSMNSEVSIRAPSPCLCLLSWWILRVGSS